jgi:hypothetical protein
LQGQIEYLIKWKGFDSSENTWEKKTDLLEDGLGDDIKKYEKEMIGKGKGKGKGVGKGEGDGKGKGHGKGWGEGKGKGEGFGKGKGRGRGDWDTESALVTVSPRVGFGTRAEVEMKARYSEHSLLIASIGTRAPFCARFAFCIIDVNAEHTSHPHTPHTSHLTPRTSHLTPHTSHLAPHTSLLPPHTSHLILLYQV